MALTDDEFALIGRLTVDVGATAARFRQQATLMIVGAIIVAAIAAARGIWFLVPITLAFGGALYWLGRVAARRWGPERAAPVLRALREAPQDVLSVEHVETSDSRRSLVTHWVVTKTPDGQLRVRAADWEPLIAALVRRSTHVVVNTRR